MKTRGCLALCVLFIYVANARRVTDEETTKLEDVIEAIEYGERKLQEFRHRNPENIGGNKLDHGIPIKSGRSNDLESDAIVKGEAKKRLIEITGMTAAELADDQVINEAFSDLLCPEAATTTCPPSEYRTMDGFCNNMDNPEWGQAFTPQRRFIQAEYGPDNTPRDSPTFPSPRLISNQVFKATENVPDTKYSGLVMAWGQLIDHDIVKTPTAGHADCCEAANADNPICYPIQVPDDDDTFTSCLSFVRSAAAISSDTAGECLLDTREHINELTSFIDGGMLYGSSDDELSVLRDESQPHLMKTKEPGNLLPTGDSPCLIIDDPANDYCQHAGDVRVNVIPTLGAMHTLLVREHNRIASELQSLNSQWDTEKIFQETRKIMGALLQHISYNEWLPLVVGDDAVDRYNLTSTSQGHSNVYNSEVDPSIRNSFAAAALRYGHSLIMPTQSYLDNTYTKQDDFSLESQQLNPHMVVQQDGSLLGDLVRWTSYKPAQTSDRMFEDGIRNHLFGVSDLPARNIQRGRDHGLPPYNKFRVFCGLSEPQNFGTGNRNPDGLSDHSRENAELLEQMYDAVEDIDLFVGAMLERKVRGGEVGPTFACLIGKQFEALKKGDSFWYENEGPTGFTIEQVNSIKNVRLSGLLCEHFNLDTIQRDPFQIERPGQCPGSTRRQDNCMIACSDRSLRLLDLSPWEDATETGPTPPPTQTQPPPPETPSPPPPQTQRPPPATPPPQTPSPPPPATPPPPTQRPPQGTRQPRPPGRG